MTYWHEAPQHTGGWQFPAQPGRRVTVLFRGRDARKAPFESRFLRYEGSETDDKGCFPHWRRNPAGWFELLLKEPLLASSMEEAKAKFAPMLAQIEDGSIDDKFTRRPYEPPVVPQQIKEIEHPVCLAKARIVQYPTGLYSVGYLVYAPNGRYFPASTPSISYDLEYEWGVTYATDEEGQRLSTLADDLADAEDIASSELDQLVARDPESSGKRPDNPLARQILADAVFMSS